MSVTRPPHAVPSSLSETFSGALAAEIDHHPTTGQAGRSAPYRVLIVDDNPSIHEDFRKILCPVSDADPHSDELETLLFGSPAKTYQHAMFDLDSAFQGEEALKKVGEALAESRPYALAFVDIQMPPGWDGVETVNRLWSVYPNLQVVICTAYSTYSWHDMRAILKQPDSLLMLKKPFDEAEIQQMAHTLTRKWELNLLAEMSLSRLDDGIHKLLAGPTEAVAPAACAIQERLTSPQADGQAIIGELMRLGQKLESTRDQLRHAEQMLVHSEKMASLGRLSAGILHELNNPLNYMIAALTALEHSAERLPESFKEDHLDMLNDMREGCTKMTVITQSLRKFAYQEAGDLGQIQVNDTVRTALRLLSVEIGDDIVVKNRLSNDLVVWGAGGKLTLVFINLIHNSTYALRAKVHALGTVPQIDIEASAAGGRININLTDNGIGISPGEISKIFDPFYTTKEVGEGVGLGLGICYQILKQFGATLSVKSEPGIRTRVEMTFPDPHFHDEPNFEAAQIRPQL